MSSLFPGVVSKLRCTTMPPVHVLCNSATTWRMWLDDSKACLEVQIDGLMIVGTVKYTMDYTIYAHYPLPEEVQVAAEGEQEATVSTSPEELG